MRDRIERAFAAWGRAAYRHAWTVIAICAAVVLALATQLPELELETSTEGFLEEDDPIRVRYDAFRDQFGRDERVILAIRPPEIFDLGFLAKLEALHREIEDEVPKLQEVISLVNARRTRGRGDELLVGDLLEEWPETPADLAALREFVLGNPLYRNLVISEDARLTTVTIETDAYSSAGGDGDALAGFDDPGGPAAGDGAPRRFLTGEENSAIVEAIEAVVKRYEAPDFEVFLAGTPTMVDKLQKAMQRDMRVFTLLAVVAIAIFLALLFRNAAGVVLPLAVAIVSAVCTLSIMALADLDITLPAQILPSFLLAVGVGNSVHVLVIFFQRRSRGAEKEDAISFALGHSGLAIVMTALTTAGGLLSFVAAELAPIAEFGMSAPVGVMLALVSTLVLLPALIAVFPIGAETGAPSRIDLAVRRLLVACGTLGTRHAPAVVLSTAGILAIALLGAFQLRFSHNPLLWFPEGDYFRRSTEVLNDELRGTMFLEVLVDTGRENGLHDPAVLERFERMRRFAAGVQRGDVYIGKSVSLADVLKEIHQALNENRPEFHAIPQDRLLVAQELLLFENSGSDDLEDVVDSRFQVGRFTMKLPLVDAIQYAPLYEIIETGFGEILGAELPFTITGLMAIVGETFTAVIHSMARSYTLALLLITPLMVLLIGNLRVGLLSMVPNLTPIIMTLGVMGWFDFSLNAFTLLIGSIAIGLAVDDTIHFMHNFRRYHDRSGDVAEAVRETLTSTGEAMLFTSVVLATGFFIYMLSSMRNLFDFGFLTGLTIVFAFLADVILSPALMALVVRRRATPALRAPETEVI